MSPEEAVYRKIQDHGGYMQIGQLTPDEVFYAQIAAHKGWLYACYPVGGGIKLSDIPTGWMITLKERLKFMDDTHIARWWEKWVGNH